VIENRFNPDCLRKARAVAGIPVEELAFHLRRGRATIYRYENGQTWPRTDVLVRLADKLNVPVSSFFECTEARS
jgi:transcriptional regulator with XRE-family HTH domain